MVTILELLSTIRQKGIKLWTEGDKLHFDAPKGAMTQEILNVIKENKAEIIEFLRNAEEVKNKMKQTIFPAPRDTNIFPVSYSQQSLWFLDQLLQENVGYNIPNAIRIKGELDIKAVETAINHIAARHEILRTTFDNMDGKPVQVISPHKNIALEVRDLSNLLESPDSRKLQDILSEEAWKPFNLKNGPLWRVILFKLGENDHILFMNIHHIISDAWSNGVFVKEFAEIYHAIIKGRDILLPQLPVQFADYALWQREHYAKNEVMDKLLGYWKKKLSASTVLDIPTDFKRPLVQSLSGKTKIICLDEKLSERLKTICKNEGVTLFMLVLSAFNVLLHRYSGQDDIIVGSVVANRDRLELQGMIGFIMNTIALRSDLSENPSFKDLLQNVRTMTLEAYAHQDMPFDLLLEHIAMERESGRSPLFNVMYIHQNVQQVNLELPGLMVSELQIENKSAPFDLRLISREINDKIELRLDYCTALYKDETADRILIHLKNFLSKVSEDISQKIDNICFMSDNEYDRIVNEFNNTSRLYPADKKIHELFEEQVMLRPNKTALIFEEEKLAYLELNKKANQLAHALKKLGVGPDVLVGVCLERSVDMVVSILGILKAGGAYVPFDPTYPRDRVEYMIKNAEVKVMLTWKRLLSKIPECNAHIICLDRERENLEKECTENLICEVQDDNLAYVIYTSGSTGAPKGAMNTHLGMGNHKLWMQDTYKLTPEDKVLQKTPFSFDVSVWEFFWPLITGACLVVAKPDGHKDPRYLLDTIIKHGITVIHFVPSMLKIFLELDEVKNCTSLRHVFCSGEALSPDLAKKFFEKFNLPLHNVYGPAECADVATAWTCTSKDNTDSIPIGKPISNVRIYILDRYLNPVPVNVPGEIYVGGVGVGKGYVNNPKLTQERFVTDPFVNSAAMNFSGTGKAKMYKTGDLGRFREDGVIEYIGRSDFQVKIRGMRVELGEIENVLSEHAGVRECVVNAWDNGKGEKFLVAYVVPAGETLLNSYELQTFLKRRLPEYMVPNFYVFLDSLPLNPNGKLDRKALPAPELTNMPRSKEYVAPRNKTEEKIAKIWEKLLGVEPVWVNDNFFELGGHSLLATSLISELAKAFSRNIPLQSIFERTTVAQIAELFEDAESVDMNKYSEPETEFEEGRL